jgi:hypothetical protein
VTTPADVGVVAAERAAQMAWDCVWEAAVLAGMGWWDDAADRLTEATTRATGTLPPGGRFTSGEPFEAAYVPCLRSPTPERPAP